jgi:16S rRNA (cytidine1402-2'-O)-methyltransferase
MSGTLYLVSTPIGNEEDISLRALRILREVDIVVCEEFKEGRRLLAKFEIQKPLETLNEHNERASTRWILDRLREGKNIAVISDSGTPVFSDPGQFLVREAIAANLRIVPIPGANALLPALIVSGFPIDNFLFFGWFSPKKDVRRRELESLRGEKRTVAVMEAPYRLLPLLKDIVEVLGEKRELCVAFDLTMPTEEVRRGKAGELLAHFTKKGKVGEFVIVIKGV